MPSSFSWATSSRTWLVSAGPSAAVGSSMIRTRALKWIARAMAMDCRWPPESDLTGDLKFRNRGFRRPMTLRVADSIAASSRLPKRVFELAAEEHVRRGVDVVGEGQRLVDRLDAQRLGVARVADADRLALDQDLAGVGGVGARQHAHQRGLAGAVAADEADDLARPQVDRDPVHGVHAAEGDPDVAHLDERRRGCVDDRRGAEPGQVGSRRGARRRDRRGAATGGVATGSGWDSMLIVRPMPACPVSRLGPWPGARRTRSSRRGRPPRPRSAR